MRHCIFPELYSQILAIFRKSSKMAEKKIIYFEGEKMMETLDYQEILSRPLVC